MINKNFLDCWLEVMWRATGQKDTHMVADGMIDVAFISDNSDNILNGFARQFKYKWETLRTLVGILSRFVFKWRERQTHEVKLFLVVCWKAGKDDDIVSFKSVLHIE